MEQFKKLPPQYKLLIGIGFLGVVAGLFYYLCIMDIEDKIGQQKVKHRTALKGLEEFKDFRGELEIAELREKYAEVIKKIEENKKIIPDKESLPELMRALESSAMEAGLFIVSKEQKDRITEDFYSKVPIRFEVKGSYLGLVKFLKLISEPGRRLVNARQFDVQSVRDKKKKKQDDSPFTAGGQVAALESEIKASLTVDGFTYTGGGRGRGKAGKKKK